jgi:hypothetical protein
VGLFTGKPRSTADLIHDPEFPARSWRLQGASEMVGHWLMLREDEESREMGRRLLSVSGWFMQDGNEWGTVRKEPT